MVEEAEDDVAHLSDLEGEETQNTEGIVDGASSANADGMDGASAVAKTAARTKLFKSPKKLVRKQREDAMKIACQYLQNKAISKGTNSRSATPQPTLDDECTIFGHLIAQKLRRMDYYERQVVMNDINNLIFKNVMKNRTNPTVFPATPTSSTSHHSSTPSPNSPLALNIWSQPPSPINNYSYPNSPSPSSFVPNYSVPMLNLYAPSSSHPEFTNISQTPSATQFISNMSQSFNTSSQVNDSNNN